MVKKFIFLLVLLIFSISSFAVYQLAYDVLRTVGSASLRVTPEPRVVEEDLRILDFGDEVFRYGLHKVKELSKLKLIANYESKSASNEILKENNCSFLVNGGFYDTDGRPLGLVVINGQRYSEFRQSRLFDGVLWVDEAAAGIKFGNVSEVELALQSGPVLVFDGEALSLQINDDNRRRRMVAMVDATGELYFMVLVGEDLYIDGPYLEELGEIVLAVAKENEIDIVSAFNLDGGSASAFFAPPVELVEWSYIGSALCETE
jgi:exopolysaccharide biosynthesis protein